MTLKKLALACAAVGAICASGFALAATYYTEVAYYSDASYTSEVGGITTFCNNRKISWGTVTPYKRTIDMYNCAYPIP